MPYNTMFAKEGGKNMEKTDLFGAMKKGELENRF